MMSHWPLSFLVKLHHFTKLNYLSCMFCHVPICTLNVHINICFCMGFRHVHVCTNDYPYSYGFSSYTCLYEWLSISLCIRFRHVHVCTNDYPFLFNGFSSCTCFYEWIFISLCICFQNKKNEKARARNPEKGKAKRSSDKEPPPNPQLLALKVTSVIPASLHSPHPCTHPYFSLTFYSGDRCRELQV